ncbi:MAG: hypothetical protein DRN92_06140 [Thermoproteota archaeon]|nr:MAG: hypothetical protein DRN92_06140 [Candidatus Korarchaeota archaeon]
MPKRTIVLSLKDQDIEKFLEYITQRLRGSDYSLTYKDGRIYLTIHGRPREIEDLIRSARKAHGDFMKIHRPVAGVRRYPKDWLVERSRGISLSLLIRALLAKGYIAEMKNDVLVSNIEPEEILNIFGQLREIYWPIRFKIKQRKVREILTIASFITNEPIMSLLYQAMEKGIIRRTEEGVYLFTINPELALDKLIGIKDYDEGSEYGS